MPGMMTIASRSPPKEKAEEEKPGEKEDSPKGGGIKRSRRRSSLRDIHYSNKGKGAAGVSSGVERTRRRGSAPGPLKVPSVEPVLPTPEQNPTADTPVDDQADQAEDDLVGEGFDADDAAGEDAGDLDGFGDDAAAAPGADGGFGEAHLTDSDGDGSDWDGEDNNDDNDPPFVDEEQQAVEDSGDDFAEQESDGEEPAAEEEPVAEEDHAVEEEHAALANPGEQWDDEDDDERDALAAALAARAGFGAKGKGDGNGGASFPGAAFHSNTGPAADYASPADDGAYVPGESDEENDE